MYDVITVGSATIDVFASVDSELIKIKTVNHEEELIAYPSGSKILMKKLDFLTGGGGTNTAASLAKQGLKVAYLGKVGSGSNSKLIIDRLKKKKVEFIGVRSKKHHAGYSVVLDSLDGDRTILTHKGANNYLTYKELNLKKLKTKWFYFSSMIKKSFETLEKLGEYAKKNNIKVAFNPSNYLAEKGYHYLKDLLINTDLLVLNKEEAILLAGKGTITQNIKKIMEYGPKQVVITDGKNGAHTIWNKKHYHIIPSKMTPVENTGAGDAFASTFLGGVIREKKITACLRMAIINSESLIMKKGAKNGLLSYNMIMKEVKKKKHKIKIKKI